MSDHDCYTREVWMARYQAIPLSHLAQRWPLLRPFELMAVRAMILGYPLRRVARCVGRSPERIRQVAWKALRMLEGTWGRALRHHSHRRMLRARSRVCP